MTKKNQQLEILQERYDLAMNASNDGIFDWNLVTNEIYYSPAWKKMLGYEDNELPNDFSIWEQLTDPEDVKRSWNMQQELIQKKRDRFETEFKMKHKDGHWVDILSRAKAIFDKNGKAIRIVGTHINISETKQLIIKQKIEQSRYQRAQELGKVGNWEYNIHSEEFWGSDGTKKIYGFDPDSKYFTPDTVEGCIPKRDEVHQALIDLIENDKEYNLEFDIITFDNHERKTITSIAQLERDVKGNPIKVIGVIQDITHQKKIAKKLKEKTDFLDKVINTSAVSTWISDDKGTLIKANPACLNFFGAKEEEVIQKYNILTDSVIKEKGYQPVIERVFQKGVVESIIIDYDVKAVDNVTVKNGTHKILKSIFTPVKNKKGKVTNVIVQAIDLSDIKQKEMRLEESEEKYRLIVENAIDGIEITQDDKLIFYNQQFAEMLGYGYEELKKINFKKIFSEEGLKDLYKRRKQRSKEKKITSKYETTLVKKDGKIINVEVSYEIIDYNRKPATFAIVRDITEKLKLERELQQSQKMDSIGRLAGGVAHDFNNKLTVIIGFTEMVLNQYKHNEDIKDDLNEILCAAQQSRDITKQLLAFARKQTIIPKVLDINDTVTPMIKMLKNLIGEKIELIWTPEPNIWKIKLDPSQIDQIIVNITINSRDAIEGDGKIIIETNNIVFDEKNDIKHSEILPGEYVTICISDNGIGMEKEMLDKIFEPFFTTKEVNKGTGLGLATVYGIIKQNNGYIYVYSEPNEGTSIKIYLPRFHTNEETTCQYQKNDILTGNGETILLVEDDKKIIKMTSKSLIVLGYTVISTTSSLEALKIADQNAGKIDLLLTDVIMPQMNGKQLADQISAKLPEIKILFISGYTANVIENQGILDKNINFLQKPFTMKELSIQIKKVLKMSLNN